MGLAWPGLYRASGPGLDNTNDKPSVSDVVCEIIVHKGLKCWRGSTEAKEHYSQFEQSQLSDERSFPFITFFDVNIV